MNTVDTAADFIWKNARLLDRLRFAYHFLDAPAQAVVSALRVYQNSDGGFGNALEADCRSPHSQPTVAHFALELLDEVGMARDAAVQREMLLPLCDWLAAVTTPDGGVPFSLLSANAHPCTPWWRAADVPVASLNPSAALAGLLRKFCVQHAWIDAADAFCQSEIEHLNTTEYHTLMPVIIYLQQHPDRAWADAHLARVAAQLSAPNVVERDPLATGYTHPPLDWAPTPQAFCRSLFSDEEITVNLDALASRQQPDGGWPITWEAISPAAEAEWRGGITIKALLTLRSYGFLPTST